MIIVLQSVGAASMRREWGDDGVDLQQRRSLTRRASGDARRAAREHRGADPVHITTTR
jgi:hypothetical protein